MKIKKITQVFERALFLGIHKFLFKKHIIYICVIITFN